jgi:hypothetical protein
VCSVFSPYWPYRLVWGTLKALRGEGDPMRDLLISELKNQLNYLEYYAEEALERAQELWSDESWVEYRIEMEKLNIEEIRNKFHKVFPFQEREIALCEERIRNYHGWIEDKKQELIQWIEDKKQELIHLSLNSSNL